MTDFDNKKWVNLKVHWEAYKILIAENIEEEEIYFKMCWILIGAYYLLQDAIYLEIMKIVDFR